MRRTVIIVLALHTAVSNKSAVDFILLGIHRQKAAKAGFEEVMNLFLKKCLPISNRALLHSHIG